MSRAAGAPVGAERIPCVGDASDPEISALVRVPRLTWQHLSLPAAVMHLHLLSLVCLLILPAEPGGVESAARITVVHDNVAYAPGLRTDWRFAALVETADQRILVDTGAKGEILLANLARLGIEPWPIHRGPGPLGQPQRSYRRTRCLAHRASRPDGLRPPILWRRFRARSAAAGARAETVSRPRRSRASLFSIGELGATPPEQALIIDTHEGLVVPTGCAHSAVVEIVRAARAYRGRDVEFLVGGFHLHNQPPSEL